jgi:hypothetical protein
LDGQDEKEYTCVATISDYGEGLAVVIALGGIVVVRLHWEAQGRIPGRVWERHACPNRSEDASIPVAHATETPLTEDSHDDCAEVPFAEALTTLIAEEASRAMEVQASPVSSPTSTGTTPGSNSYLELSAVPNTTSAPQIV